MDKRSMRKSARPDLLIKRESAALTSVLHRADVRLHTVQPFLPKIEKSCEGHDFISVGEKYVIMEMGDGRFFVQHNEEPSRGGYFPSLGEAMDAIDHWLRGKNCPAVTPPINDGIYADPDGNMYPYKPIRKHPVVF